MIKQQEEGVYRVSHDQLAEVIRWNAENNVNGKLLLAKPMSWSSAIRDTTYLEIENLSERTLFKLKWC